MVGIGIRTLRILFKWLELAFECFERLSNGLNWHAIWIVFQWFEFAFKCFESCSNGWNPVRMLGILFEQLEFAFESRSNDLNLHSNGSNLVRMVRICIQMVQIPFECLEFAFECFETRSNGWNLHSSASNTVQKVEFALSALNPFEWLELAFECFESRSIVRIGIRMVQILFGNFHSNGSNLVRLGKIFLESACYTIFTVLRNFLGLVHAFVTV